MSPLQGFLNAIVYGWMRDDFLYTPCSSDKETGGDNREDIKTYLCTCNLQFTDIRI